jgi:hypothetical protein
MFDKAYVQGKKRSEKYLRVLFLQLSRECYNNTNTHIFLNGRKCRKWAELSK